MSNPEDKVVPTIPCQRQFEFAKCPYPPVKPESPLVKTAIAAICAFDRRYVDHIHEPSIILCRAWVKRAWAR